MGWWQDTSEYGGWSSCVSSKPADGLRGSQVGEVVGGGGIFETYGSIGGVGVDRSRFILRDVYAR